MKQIIQCQTSQVTIGGIASVLCKRSLYLAIGAIAVMLAGPMVVASQQQEAEPLVAEETEVETTPDDAQIDAQIDEQDVEDLDEPEVGIVINGGNVQLLVRGGNIQGADVQVWKLLAQEGFAPIEIEGIIGGRSGLQPNSRGIDSAWPVRVIAEDDEELYLPMGMMKKVPIEAEETLALPFNADGPGMLTIAYAGGLGIGVEVTDAQGRVIDWESTRIQQPRDNPIRFALVIIGRAGEYSVRIGAESSLDVMLGAQWIPFAQTEDSPEAAYLPAPDPDTELQLVSGTRVVGEIVGGDEELSHLWCRFDAEEDGQLIVLANSDSPGADLTMSSFNRGSFGQALEYVDSDLNGNVANEGITLDVLAGETYYIRVNLLSDSGTAEVEVRTGWLDADAE